MIIKCRIEREISFQCRSQVWNVFQLFIKAQDGGDLSAIVRKMLTGRSNQAVMAVRSVSKLWYDEMLGDWHARWQHLRMVDWRLLNQPDDASSGGVPSGDYVEAWQKQEREACNSLIALLLLDPHALIADVCKMLWGGMPSSHGQCDETTSALRVFRMVCLILKIRITW